MKYKHKLLNLILVILLILVSTMTLARAKFLWDLGFMAGYHQGNLIGYTSGVTDGYRFAHHQRPLHPNYPPIPEATPPNWMYHPVEANKDVIEYAASN